MPWSLKAQRGQKRATAHQRGYGGKGYRVFRAHVLSRDPICTHCDLAPSTVPHHINGDQYDNRESNGRGLCRECHERIHGRKH